MSHQVQFREKHSEITNALKRKPLGRSFAHQGILLNIGCRVMYPESVFTFDNTVLILRFESTLAPTEGECKGDAGTLPADYNADCDSMKI